MKVAIIDMGTNTFHLMIVKVVGSGFEVIKKVRESVKIGAGGINKGLIIKEAEERGLKALEKFKEIITEHEVDRTFATATSAIRNASNGAEIAKRFESQTGIAIEIISGLEEAESIYLGVKQALDLGRECSLIMDIGGGSIEFILANQDEIFWMQSFEIGGQRMLEKFNQFDPISLSEIRDELQYLDGNLEALYEQVAIHQPKTLVGSSGTFDTLSDIYQNRVGLTKDEKATEYPLSVDGFREIHNELIMKNRAERMEIPGMIEMRVEMIVVASVLVDHMIKRCEIEKMRVSAYALKEGTLFKKLSTIS